MSLPPPWELGSSRDPEPKEGPWPLSGPWRLSRSLFDLREGFLPPREEHLSPGKVWDVLFWDTRQEELEWVICRHVCMVTELGKMILFCSEHYQVNCTSSITVGSIHMKLWNSWWLCLGNCSFLIGSSITHEFNSKQCYQQIQMIYILSSIYNNETLFKSTAFRQNLLHYIVQSFFRLRLSKDSFLKKLSRRDRKSVV